MRKHVFCIMRKTKAQFSCASSQVDQCICFRCLDLESEIPILYRSPIAEQACMCLTWTETLTPGFLETGFICGLGPGIVPFEPRYEKTGFLDMRKQRRRSASRLPLFSLHG